MSPFQLIVGLGNPGSKYESTRHNVGFMAVDNLAKKWGISGQEKSKLHGWVAQGKELVLLKPNTYMNDSGRAVQAVRHWFKIMPRHVLVIYDDLDLPFGKLRLRKSGSAGGHNGMKSIIQHLGTQEFPRLRIGIGRPEMADSAHYVLEAFSEPEKEQLSQILTQAIQVIELGIKQGLDQAMNRCNAWSLT
ncbi:peptidyl-tRNA hydrolase [Gloeomargarita lithophora Alchichica-D10]|uniref:Peptidyl-tRNA hydrolase n=1 Tax=Gloeomargarita lithophora Alchichica-D10 TaxID=1188229 RepID=A0A1J0ADV0_9CYAN|nr:aminoacyl-tRNA hydrolase [Gloeomargarita lithophora]APB34118.1 peptidyl-tRNA hydrolase [Gloeomargarita lithophora Alchichica-D10]